MGVGNLEVAVIGANRRKAGLGPFIAQKFDRLKGVDLTAFWCRTEESARVARAAFRAYGNAAEPYYSNNGSPESSIKEMLRLERPDIVAICTPNGTHLDYLELVLDHNDTSDSKTHVLLEKPLAESSPSEIEEDLDRAIELVERAEEQGIVLAYNASLAVLVEPYKKEIVNPTFNSFAVAMNMKHGKGELPSPRTLEYSILSHAIGILQTYFNPWISVKDLVREENTDNGQVSINYNFTLRRNAIFSNHCTINLSRSPNLDGHERYFGVNNRTANIENKDGELYLVFGEKEVPVPDFQDTLIANMVKVVRRESTGFFGSKLLLDGRAMIMNQVLLHTLMGDLAEDKAQQYCRRMYN
jgi:hypothetical protein